MCDSRPSQDAAADQRCWPRGEPERNADKQVPKSSWTWLDGCDSWQALRHCGSETSSMLICSKFVQELFY